MSKIPLERGAGDSCPTPTKKAKGGGKKSVAQCVTETPPLNATLAMIQQLGQRILGLQQELYAVQGQNPPQTQEIANLNQAIADAQAELAAITTG